MFVKIHSATRYVVAICDEDLIDKQFYEGIRQIDLTSTFFKGEKKMKDEVNELMRDMVREDASFNIVGKESCDLAVECGLVKREEIGAIAGIPMVLSLL
jgi:hypothetical protein